MFMKTATFANAGCRNEQIENLLVRQLFFLKMKSVNVLLAQSHGIFFHFFDHAFRRGYYCTFS